MYCIFMYISTIKNIRSNNKFLNGPQQLTAYILIESISAIKNQVIYTMYELYVYQYRKKTTTKLGIEKA